MQPDYRDVVLFTVVLVLPFVAWVFSRPPVWRRVRLRLEPLAVRLWRRLVVVEEPAEQDLRRWALVRLDQLQHDLERVRRLLLDDEWMTATRQIANRLAHQRLLRDVREAEVAAAAFGPIEVVAAPTPRAMPRLTFAAPAARSTVEVMEFGPTGRWL